MSRIEKLKEFIKEDPNDPFPLYALALEYLRDQPLHAEVIVQQLLSKFPDYLPSYYPAALMYMGLGKTKDGQTIFHLGMALARRQGDRKTESELKEAYEQWFPEEGSR